MRSMLAYIIHDFDPFFIKFSDEFFIRGIKWYGVAYFIGFFCAFTFLLYYKKHSIIKFSENQLNDFIFYLFIGVVIGGRLGYVLMYEFTYYCNYPMRIFAIWNGGMSSHGGFIGILIALYMFSKKYEYQLLSLADLTILLAPIGIFLVRIANFINAEIVGRPTTVSWAVAFPPDFLPRHPSQLYEAVFEGLIPLIFTQVYFKLNKCKSVGKLSTYFLIYYGCVRIMLEFFREPDAPLILQLTRGQFYSIFVIIIGIILKNYVFKTNKNSVFNS